MRYFEVCAKCGHVGRHKYYRGLVYLSAADGREAARVARAFPRVKQDHKDAILSVREISLEEFRCGRAQMRSDPFWLCENVQEQRLRCAGLEEHVLREEPKPAVRRVKHSLRKCYNDADPLFAEYSRYRGTIDLFGTE